MNISGNLSPDYSSPTAGSRIANLEKQIRNLEKQIAAEAKSSDDSKTKMQVTQQLEVEMQTTQLQIQQIQESVQQSQEKQPSDASVNNSALQPNDETKAGLLLDAFA